MSRIGKNIIAIPAGVTVTYEHGIVHVKGLKGELARNIKERLIEIKIADNQIALTPHTHSIEARALWGTYGSHIKNMIKGVTEGFQKRLQIEGVGYRAQVNGVHLVLNLGFSHPVEVHPKEGIIFQVEKNIIIISGIDKERVGEAASAIRSIRKPEPYKGKGVRYEGEVVRRKAGKKAATTAGK